MQNSDDAYQFNTNHLNKEFLSPNKYEAKNIFVISEFREIIKNNSW